MLRLLQHGLARLGITREPADHFAGAGRMVPEIIRGGDAAPELAMQPVDWTDDIAAPISSAVQLKADGIRALYIDGRLVTREGVPLDCAAHCLGGLKRLEERLGEPMFLDGEYVEEAGFAATQSAFRRRKGQGVLWLFDAVPLIEWLADRCEQPLIERLDRLRRAIPHAESRFVGMLDYWVMSPAEARAKAEELWALGYEGIVAKRVGSVYTRRRSDHWLRLKREFTVDCRIVETRAKSVVAESRTGLRMTAPWRFSRPPQLGEIVEVRANPITGGGVRGVTITRLRPDKGALA